MKTGEQKKGLYTPQFESDACGIGLIANLNNEKSHLLVSQAIDMLEKMEHRGACGAEANTGDGSGILIQIPHQFFVEESKTLGFELPAFGHYGVGNVFFPADEFLKNKCKEFIAKFLLECGLELIAYRNIPSNKEGVGPTAISAEPVMEQIFIKAINPTIKEMDLERRLFLFRSYTASQIGQVLHQVGEDFYFTSCSYKTIVYKGQLTTYQLRPYFPDLQNPLVDSAIALVHSRFSTNTFPKWRLAQPFRYIAHNGEINTIQGNLNKWKTKEHLFESDYFTKEEIAKIFPVCDPNQSDSASFDNVVEFLTLNGRTLPEVLMMMIPEAWQHDEQMETSKKAFYEYHQSLMEPWDGPASICFTDGIVVGATLDRNGLRPSRYCITKNNHLVLASEAGVLPIPAEDIVYKNRLQAGKILIADLEKGTIIGDEELKEKISKQAPYADWLKENKVNFKPIKKKTKETSEAGPAFNEETWLQKQKLFGWTKEDLTFILSPMATKGKGPIGSMGSDTPLAILSNRPQHLANYFKQLFAQVTNPPIDPIRERSVMSLFTLLGAERNILKPGPEHCQQIQLDHPVLSNAALEQLKVIDNTNFTFTSIETLLHIDSENLEEAIERICQEAKAAVENGSNVLILSDKKAKENFAPIPSLLATGAIHHFLIREGLRSKTSLVIEAGDVWESQHFATLLAFGASAVNAYMAFANLPILQQYKFAPSEIELVDLEKNYIQSIKRELLKIFSKIGISTLQSYQGAQIFEIIGLKEYLVEHCFKGTVARLGGIGFEGIEKEIKQRYIAAYESQQSRMEAGGVYQWKEKGEAHLFNPKTIHLLQKSTKSGSYAVYKKYAEAINDQTKQFITLRGLLDFKDRKSIPIEEVESAENILKRFSTGAMSFGSISYEAHSTLSIAMNRIGAKSNSGEGGEDSKRYKLLPNGDNVKSAIKQVASGRFGVTSNYLTNAEELQIKMAQGAKPGEGGQLPGHKVNDWIGRVRHSTPGVGLISPPPHHDIYSIEDLAQLIYDLKNANRKARISVKLVSKAGVGVVAAGVAKAHADVILISGHDGGTGASPLSSIRHAGIPWEMGLAETHQTLVKNKLRNRVTLQTDGQIRTGRDLAIATLLGAEEWGVATAALVVEGCIMMRKCHLNTCPVGVATQDPELRKKFMGKPEHVINFFQFLVQDLREIMAELGFRTVNEMVGQASILKVREEVKNHWKVKELDLGQLTYQEQSDSTNELPLYKTIEQNHGIDEVLDWQILKESKAVIERDVKRMRASFPIANIDRAVGTIVSNEISKKHGEDGLPDASLVLHFIGSAGQSFAAFGAKGIRFELEGESNDYMGKGLSGSDVFVYPDRKATFNPAENAIIGNVALYGATSGKVFIYGQAGERFAVRNSGAIAVVEGVGDHACEYMTGGVVLVLGNTGKNFAAGMSGGIAYVYDKEKTFPEKCNMDGIELEQLQESDLKEIHSLLIQHLNNTQSITADNLLAFWKEEQKHFIKVMPTEYKRVLEERAKVKEAREELNATFSGQTSQSVKQA